MNVIIEGKRAVLKKNFSIEYNEDNPLFTESEGYTLSLEFPLKNCPDNINIFGHISRKDINTRRAVFICEIFIDTFLRKGIITVLEISVEEVKVQFLCGLSVKNYTEIFSPFSDIYVDEMNISPCSQYISYPESSFHDYTSSGAIAIRLPWKEQGASYVNNNINNGVWVDDNVSTFPYLLPLTEKILESLGYIPNFSQWKNDRGFANIIACNTFVGQTYYTQSLPHWTLEEYLNNLGLFMHGYFCTDHYRKEVNYVPYTNIKANSFKIDNILNSYTIETTDDCKYIGCNKLSYSGDDSENWKFDCCPEIINNITKVVSKMTFDTIGDLLSYAHQLNMLIGVNTSSVSDNVGSLFYVKDLDTYFAIKCASMGSTGSLESGGSYNRKDFYLRPIGRFCPFNSDKSNESEISIIPALVPSNCYGKQMEVVPRTKVDGFITEKYTDINGKLEPLLTANILNGNKDVEKYSFSILYVADARSENVEKTKIPFIDYFYQYDGSRDHRFPPYMAEVNYRLSRIKNEIPTIDESAKYKIEFISDDMPSVFSIFYIQGKKYLCEKISVDITSNGVSQLKKGTFYQIVD